MSGLSAAPSWVLTTLQWLEAVHHIYVVGTRASGANPQQRLKKSLIRISFQRVESELAGETLGAYEARIAALVDYWDSELHRQLQEFIQEGGYAEERKRFAAKGSPLTPAPGEPIEAPKSGVKRRAHGSKSGEIIPEKVLEDVEATLKPPSAHGPEQDLSEVVEHEILSKDTRLGAW